MRNKNPNISVFCFAVLASVLPRPLIATDIELEQRVDAYLQPYVEIGHQSGTIFVAKGDEILYHRPIRAGRKTGAFASHSDSMRAVSNSAVRQYK